MRAAEIHLFSAIESQSSQIERLEAAFPISTWILSQAIAKIRLPCEALHGLPSMLRAPGTPGLSRDSSNKIWYWRIAMNLATFSTRMAGLVRSTPVLPVDMISRSISFLDSPLSISFFWKNSPPVSDQPFFLSFRSCDPSYHQRNH